MRIFRQFDYFRKSTSPEQIKPTCVGGLISLACMISISALLYSELMILFKPEFKKNTTVSTDPHKHSHIIVNLDIDFPNVPCFLIDISVSTSVNSLTEEEIYEKLAFIHIDQQENKIATFDGVKPFKDVKLNDEKDTPKKIKEFYDNEYFCKILGSIDMTKVTGQVDFRLRGETRAYQKFFNKKENKSYQAQLNHKINKVTFGDENNHEAIVKTFGQVDNGQHTMFNMFHEDANKVNHDHKINVEENAQEYYYFMKLVPHVFVDVIEQNEKTSYSYSLKHNKKEAQNKNFATTQIILDYAPIKMIISKENRPVGQFAINMCSIIGGVFIIFGLLNGMILRCCDKLKTN